MGGDYGGPLFHMAYGWGLWWTTLSGRVCGDYGEPLFLLAMVDHSPNCLLLTRSCDSLSCDKDLPREMSEVRDDQIFEECSEQRWWMGTVSGCGH